MAVFGGKSRWARTLLGAVACGAWSVLAFTACGSRTSILDQDLYLDTAGTPSVGGGGRSGGVAGANARAGGGNSGVSGSGTGGGAGGSGGKSNVAGAGGKTNAVVDPDLAIAPCARYCPGYGTQCVVRLKGAECIPTCEGELNGFGQTCQTLGIKALTCLTPFFTPGGSNCDAAVGRALAKCKKVVDQFNACKKKASGGNNPGPGTAPDFDPTTCDATDHYADPSTCLYSYSCASGVYITTCSTDPSTGAASCICIQGDGSQQTVNIKGGPEACERGVSACF
ncbi:MAG TPA: hypothetical protein VHB79_10525 [Polyangiaceae bacterium]|nr:hypothetical protein [Polyangiaceae bacterium]